MLGWAGVVRFGLLSEAPLRDYASRRGVDSSGSVFELATVYPIEPMYKKVIELISPSAECLNTGMTHFEKRSESLSAYWTGMQSNSPAQEHNASLEELYGLLGMCFILEPTITDLEPTLKDMFRHTSILYN